MVNLKEDTGNENSLVEISKKKSTKIKKALYMFFDWLLPDYCWGGGRSYL